MLPAPSVTTFAARPDPASAPAPPPADWRSVLDELGPVFARRSTHQLFIALACGLVLAERATVTGMAAAAGLGDQWRRACWFFASAAWDVDQLGLAVARLAVRHLLTSDEPLVVAVDGTFLARWGRKVAACFWAYNGAAQGGRKIGYGNTWVVAALVVRLPFCPSPVALPILFRLWRGRGTDSQPALAAQMLTLLAQAFPDRRVHGVGDAAFHGPQLADLPTNADHTTRLPANAVLCGPAPPRTGKRGRPAKKGPRLGRPAQIAADPALSWVDAVADMYGTRTAVTIAVCPVL